MASGEAGDGTEEAAMTDINNVGTRDASETRTTERAGAAALVRSTMTGSKETLGVYWIICAW